MIKNKLTSRAIQSKKIPGYYSDGGNLYLRVSKELNKTWAFYYKKNGKRTELGFGSLNDISLEQARDKASELRKQLKNGVDPIEEKQRIANEIKAKKAKYITFEQCAINYIEAHKTGWKNKKHIQQWHNTLSQYAYPVFGDLEVKLVDTNLITKCLNPIWLTKNETAGRLRGRIEVILDWATVHGYREGLNPSRWKGHLDKLLAKPSKIQTVKHHKALPFTEIALLLADLHQQEGVSARCLEFTILTAARTGEAIGATWSEIDIDNKIWTIPSIRMKAKREHRIPLSPAAICILNKMLVFKLNDYIFPGTKNGLSNMSMSSVLKRMNISDITVHGFRSTFRDWAAETTSYPGEVVEMALAHTIKNKTEEAYRRGDLLEKRSQLMEDWANFCSKTN